MIRFNERQRGKTVVAFMYCVTQRELRHLLFHEEVVVSGPQLAHSCSLRVWRMRICRVFHYSLVFLEILFTTMCFPSSLIPVSAQLVFVLFRSYIVTLDRT